MRLFYSMTFYRLEDKPCISYNHSLKTVALSDPTILQAISWLKLCPNIWNSHEWKCCTRIRSRWKTQDNSLRGGNSSNPNMIRNNWKTGVNLHRHLCLFWCKRMLLSVSTTGVITKALLWCLWRRIKDTFLVGLIHIRGGAISAILNPTMLISFH